MALACVSLLAVQLTGLHMHVNAHGYVGTPQRTHVHSVGPHNHGDVARVDDETIHSHERDPTHDGDKDVSINEHSSATSKLVILSAWLSLDLLMPVTPGEKITPYTVVPRPVGRHTRWRPPLRGPPRLS